MAYLGSGSIGRAVASDTRDPRFVFRLWQILVTFNFFEICVENTKISKNEAGNGPFLKNVELSKSVDRRSDQNRKKLKKGRDVLRIFLNRKNILKKIILEPVNCFDFD